MKESTNTVYTQVRNWVQNDLLPASTEILGSVSDGLLSALGMLLNVVIGIIVSIYLMAGKERFCAQAKRLLYTIFSEKRANRILSFGKDINWSFAKFFSGKIIDSIIVAIITFIALSIAERVRSCKKAAAQNAVRQPGSICCFILQNILPAAGFAVVAPVGVVKVCGAEDRRRGRLGFWSAVKGEPGSGAAGFDAEAHL